MSASTAMTTLDGAARALPEPEGLLPDPPAVPCRRGLLPQLVLVALCAVYATGAAVGWGSDRLALIMGDFGLGVAALAAAVSCFLYARGPYARFRPAWLLFGISSAMASLGNLVWGWYEVVLRLPVPSPSYADLFFLCFAPPTIVGLLVLAKRPVTKAGWVCLGLDAWLIGGSLLTLAWSLALARTAQAGGEGVAHTALSLAYPLLDIVLVSMVLALHFRQSAVNRSAVNTAIGALALTVMCDALFTSPLLNDSYRSGHLLDAGWFAGSLLLAYAPWTRPRDGGSEDEERTPVVHEPLPGPRGGQDLRADGERSGDDPDRALRAPAHATECGPAREPAHTALRQSRPGRQDLGCPAESGDEHGPYPVFRPIVGSLGALAPYLAAAVCTLGILYTVLNGRSVDRMVLLTGGTVVLALVVRQGIMLLDNMTLTQELAHKENHFRSLVQGSSDVIMIAAPSGVLRYVSPAAAGVYGRPAEDLVGMELAQLIHPADLDCVVHEVRRFLAAGPAEEPTTRIECRFRSGDDSWLNVESTVNRHYGGLIFNSRDVTERVRLQAQLQHNAEHDPLTDLPNRSLFTRRVQQALSGRRASDRGAVLRGTAVLFIDLDGFKAVNDTVGHQAGDELLIRVARRLRDAVRKSDTASRLGGDEFAALIVGDGARDREAREPQILELADRLRAALSQPYLIDGNEVRVNASIGVAFADPVLKVGELLRNADLAMYRAKAGGKGRVELYRPHMQQDVVRRVEESATRLRAALHDGEFALLHQPVVSLQDGRITSVCAQARWRSSQGLLLTPAEFLRAAEDGEKTAELGHWLLEEAVEQAARREATGLAVPVAVRVGARRLLDRSLPLGSIEDLLTRYGLPFGSLVVEVTGADPRVCPDELERRLTALRRVGVRIALDGFGSSRVAITALRRLPVDVLKLDRSLVEGVAESARLHKITGGLLRIAGDLGMQSVADGVDLPEQAVALRAMGCTHGQGKAFSGPLDEYRLRRALGIGHCPMPHGVARPGYPGSGSAGSGGCVPGAVPVLPTSAVLCSHDETPVPPT